MSHAALSQKPPSTYHLVMNQGEDWRLVLRLKDINGQAIVLTDTSFEFKANLPKNGTFETLNLSIGSGVSVAGNVVTVALSISQLATFEVGRGKYELDFVDNLDVEHRLLRGDVIIRKDVDANG